MKRITSDVLNDFLKKKYNGEAYVSLSKALMTKASAVIPIFPLYAALLYRVMKEKGIHEGTIEQKHRLLKDMIYGGKPEIDEERRLRPDNWEMREDVQSEVEALWNKVTPENFKEISDYKGVREEFMQLNGFDFDNVDYDTDIDLEELAQHRDRPPGQFRRLQRSGFRRGQAGHHQARRAAGLWPPHGNISSA